MTSDFLFFSRISREKRNEYFNTNRKLASNEWNKIKNRPKYKQQFTNKKKNNNIKRRNNMNYTNKRDMCCFMIGRRQHPSCCTCRIVLTGRHISSVVSCLFCKNHNIIQGHFNDFIAYTISVINCVRSIGNRYVFLKRFMFCYQ